MAAQRSQAAAVLHRIEVLDWRRTHMLAVERNSRNRLHYLRSSMRGISAAMTSQQAALSADQAALAAMIVGDYKTSGTDATAYVLSSGSFSDLVERVDEVSRINATSEDMIHRIRAAQGMLAAQRRAFGTQSGRVAVQLGRQEAAQRGLESAIAARRAVLAGIDAQIQGQLAAERTRRAGLAGSTGDAATAGDGRRAAADSPASRPGTGPDSPATAPPTARSSTPPSSTAASPWLPFNTMLRVTDLATGRSVVGARQRPRPVRPRRARPVRARGPDHRPRRLAAVRARSFSARDACRWVEPARSPCVAAPLALGLRELLLLDAAAMSRWATCAGTSS